MKRTVGSVCGVSPGTALVSRVGAWAWRFGCALSSNRGATTAEYALILALIVIALMGTLGELRDAVAGKLQEVINELRR